jgi:hypothetical protein
MALLQRSAKADECSGESVRQKRENKISPGIEIDGESGLFF